MNILKPVAELMAAIARLFPTLSLGGSEEWPNLPKNFIGGRVASEDDVNEGRAVLGLERGGVVIGKPIATPFHSMPSWMTALQSPQ